MAIEDDVLVIGGGLAGMTAALAAARTGARVRLLTAKQSTLRHASGLVDVLGYPPADADRESEGPLVDPFDAVGDAPEGHPYERAGVEALAAGLDLFDGVVGDRYRGDHTPRNALVPTHGGTVKPTARYPASAAAGLASDGRDALLVGFASLSDFDAPLAAAHLESAGVPFGTRGATVRFPGDLRDDAKVTRYAHLLDDDGTVTVDGRDVDVRAALADRIEPYLEGEERVGLPAVLGETRAREVREALEFRLGVPVFEVPMGPPSLPGLRLSAAFERALDDAGVRVNTSNPVVDHEPEGGRIERVLVERNRQHVPYRADEYVLATGGLVGKGIESDRGGVREPIFGCHVPHPGDRYDWFEDDPFGDHPFAGFGVTVDRELRPLTGRDEREFVNLRAAGAVLGGYDFAAEKSGSGVSLATGHRAGRLAGEEVGA